MAEGIDGGRQPSHSEETLSVENAHEKMKTRICC